MSKSITFEEFLKDHVKIEYLNDFISYGHHPFPLITQKGEHKEFNSLCGLNLQSVYKRLKHYIDEDYNEIMVSVDFPPVKDIPNDFILALQISNKELVNIWIIEYDIENGNIIKESNGEKYNFIPEFSKELKKFTEI